VPRPKTLQFAPVSFDVHFQEMFTTWHRSGAVVMITEEMRYFGQEANLHSAQNTHNISSAQVFL
jgi:hypothetical protein